MSCASCGDGNKAKGCNNHGGCSTGGCNRLNTYDWLATKELDFFSDCKLVEVSFKNGSRKSFFRIPEYLQVQTGEMVVVDSGSGYDIGRVSLSGELVRLQLRKKRLAEDRLFQPVVRLANKKDMERLGEARNLDKLTMVRARAIARMLDLDMKIGDVEYQGDLRKATFYFTSPGRVDFRELIRHYAKEFKVKIEMRQIGSRQESSRIGGIGSCGRELCCSTWLTNFKSVTTQAARYQNLSINQAKLSGLCGRLKCCLNYELDLYMESLQGFPIEAEKLKSKSGNADLVKVDIFKKIMYYSVNNGVGRPRILALTPERVSELLELNKKGEVPQKLEGNVTSLIDLEEEIGFVDVTGEIEITDEPSRRKKRRSGKKRKSGRKNRDQNNSKSTS